MNSAPEPSVSLAPPPRAAAVSGIVFCALYAVSLVLIRMAMPADPSDPGAWLTDPAFRDRIELALNLAPLAGIAFLWFMAVLRGRIGAFEDRFFATVFLGSGLLFVGMLFTCAAVALALLNTFGTPPPGASDAYRFARGLTHSLMNPFGMRMAAVFMFATSSIALRTAMLARWVSFTGFAFGSTLLLVITDFPWIALLLPCWVLLVSVWILAAELHRHRRE